MTREQFEELAATYSSADPDANERRFLEWLGAWSSSWRALFGAVVADLDPVRLGIGWWEHHLDTPRRILISDQLVVCLQSVTQNMKEARLHALELRDAQATATRLESERFRAGPLAPMGPMTGAQEIAELEVRTHLAGFFRAIGSVLDCLAAVVIGIAAIPQSIFLADFKALTKNLSRLKPNAPATHREVGDDLRRLVDQVGPGHWLDWAIEYRNMLVHRGRHMTLKSVQLEESRIVTSRGQRSFLATVVHIHTIDPGRAEVEVLRDARQHDLMLKENAGTTVEGISASTLALVEGTCDKLLRVWTQRRAAPDLCPQPPKQWDLKPRRSVGFLGYAPGSVPISFQQVRLMGVPFARLQAAAVFDDKLHAWNTDEDSGT